MTPFCTVVSMQVGHLFWALCAVTFFVCVCLCSYVQLKRLVCNPKYSFSNHNSRVYCIFMQLFYQVQIQQAPNLKGSLHLTDYLPMMLSLQMPSTHSLSQVLDWQWVSGSLWDMQTSTQMEAPSSLGATCWTYIATFINMDLKVEQNAMKGTIHTHNSSISSEFRTYYWLILH